MAIKIIFSLNDTFFLGRFIFFLVSSLGHHENHVGWPRQRARRVHPGDGAGERREKAEEGREEVAGVQASSFMIEVLTEFPQLLNGI